MLKFKEFCNWLIDVNEANVWRNQSASYIIHPKYDSKVPSELNGLNYIWTDDDVNTLPNPRIFLIPRSGKIVGLTVKEASNLLKAPKNSLMKTETDSNVYLVVVPDTQFLIQTKRSGETTTNVKEGMVVLFYYSSVNIAPNQNNERKIISVLLNELDSIPSQSLDSKTIEEIREYLTNLASNKKTVEDLNDFWSSAALLKNRLGGNSYIVSRSGVFNQIRDLGSKLTGYQADKWCPGDIYLINPSAIDSIPGYLKEIQKNIQPDSIEKLNLLFAHELTSRITEEDPLFGSIIAISLKKEKAQAGKAKQFLKSLTKDETEYNVTKDELGKSNEELISAIESYRQTIAKSCAQSVTTINLIQETGYTGNGNRDKIQSKFASVKLATKLLSDPSKIDDNLLRGVAFGMSLTGVNPTFFKVIGSAKGSAKLEKYPAGEMIFLMDAGLENPESKIEVKDLNTNTSVIFTLNVRKGEEPPKFIQFTCKSNGNTQATLEIEKSK